MARRQQTRSDVGAMLGISRQALSQRLNGKTPWKYWELDRLAERWGIPLSTLTGEHGQNHTRVSNGT